MANKSVGTVALRWRALNLSAYSVLTILVLTLVQASSIPKAYAATIHVNSNSALSQALASAEAGDIILVANGSYSALSIDDLHFDDYVTIKSENGVAAVLSGINFTNSSFIRIDSLHVAASGREAIGIFENSHHIQIINSRVHGLSQFDRNSPSHTQVSSLYAINVNGDAHNLLIENNNASDAQSSAYLFGNVRDSIIRGNSCDCVASDCFKFFSADNILFENNWGAQNIHPPEGAHVDFVQGQGAMSNSIFRGNVAIMGSRTFQGLFFDDANYTNLTFENNLIYTANNRGISVSGSNSSGIVARYNTVLRVAGSQKATFISLPDNSIKEFNIKANNTTKNENRFLNNGVISQWDDDDDIAHYSDYYLNAMHGPYATIEDFAPIKGSLADNQFGAFARIKELLNSTPSTTTRAIPIVPTIILLLED